MGALGVMAALVRRNETGKGEKVDVSLLDSCISLMAYYFSYYFCSGIIPGPQGSGHLGVSPYGSFQTKDGRWIATGINWPRIARVIGADWLIYDSRFNTQQGRVDNKLVLERIMQEYFIKEDAETWLELFRAEDMPGGLVQNLSEAASDPQVINNAMVLDIKGKGKNTVRLAGNPVKMRGINEQEFAAPPSLGEHTREILRGVLQYPPRKINRIIAEAKSNEAELAKRLHKTS